MRRFWLRKGSRGQPHDRTVAITQANCMGNLLWLPSLLVQLYYLLIIARSGRTPRQTDFLYMSWFLEVAILSREMNRLALLIPIVFSGFAGGKKFRLATCQKHLDSLRQVFDNMKPIAT